ncbi:hypothetical protein HHI36_005322 [Cryptolaemus montrouzieri]|uniref:C2H2-type domain-containing protein n=1 Tax=Cryptolaemus montrouzieri TaxID=559131 RepID=A0ABD2NVC2_9CUCU
MWLHNYHWHFDYVRLAKDTGFCFEKTRAPLDKNKICVIDLDKIIKDGDVGTIEQCMPTIVQYNIETGEHRGILDQNFLKLFRMSQLAVEYLLFCKKYLDHTVTLLKEDMKNLISENKELKLFNDELKQHTDVLLEKLKTKDLISTFKCSKCLKAFSTEQFLAAHIERRHVDNKQSFGLDVEMEIKEIKQKLNNTEKLIKNEEMNPNLEDTLNKNYSKVGSSLKNLEVQMGALWEKLQDLEVKKNCIQAAPEEEFQETFEVDENKRTKPKYKKKFDNDSIVKIPAEHDILLEEGNVHKEQMVVSSKSSSKTRYDDLDRIDALEDLNPEPSKSVTVVKSASTMYETDTESEENSNHLQSESISEISMDGQPDEDAPAEGNIVLHKGKSLSTLGRRSLTSIRKASLSPEVGAKLKKEVERLLNERFASLGLSMEWKGIPEQTYLRTMDILHHQINLVQKSYPNYKNIRQKLLKTLDEEIRNKGIIKAKQENIKNIKKSKKHRIRNVAGSLKSLNNRSSTYSMQKPQSEPQIEIRNRKIFDTDSSSEEIPSPQVKRIPSNIIKRTAPYSAVIQELKRTQQSDENLAIPADNEQNLLAEENIKYKDIINEDIEKINSRTKGVLKNFPSMGSLPKKRVLFDLKSQNSIDQKTLLKDVGGGSTTSVASSVLDLSEDNTSPREQDNTKIKAKEILENLSDSDFSFDSSNENEMKP